MNQAYVAKLGLIPQIITVGGQKIAISALNTYKMVISKFLVHDKLDKAWFFEKTFLLADTSIKKTDLKDVDYSQDHDKSLASQTDW